MPPVPTPAAPADQTGLQSLVQTIIAFIGLPAGSPVEQVMTAVKTVRDQMNAPPDPAKYMPMKAVQAMLAEPGAELRQASEGRAQQKVAQQKVARPSGKVTSTGRCANRRWPCAGPTQRPSTAFCKRPARSLAGC